jgi:CRISPR-associated protein Csx17
MSQQLALHGCVSTILAGYLKALAVHRLVANQHDPRALSWWDQDGVFRLDSVFDGDGLTSFFTECYAPTAIVTPWNGGSGFFPKDQQVGIATVEASTDARFECYRETIRICRATLSDIGLTAKPEKEAKQRLVELLRARLPDDAVTWLDAACALSDQLRYPPILGTGGNDGRLDFGNNFLQRVAQMLLGVGNAGVGPDVPAWLRASLFGESAKACEPAAAGQFSPGRAGGANMTNGLDADGRVNPWDFVLALEGAVTFAGAAVRRLESARYGSASFPFHVNSSSAGSGTSSAPDEESARAELWLPLWSSPTPYAELRVLFGEGRLELQGRRARTGLDAVRALAALGVDRGIPRFERMGLMRRNGLAYLAVSLGTYPVRRIERADLLRDLDPFVNGVERLDRPHPAISGALRRLHEAMFEAARTEAPLAPVIAAAGALERAVAGSPKARGAVRPVWQLSNEWFEYGDDGSPEFAIARAVASWDIRDYLEPVHPATRKWTDARPEWSDRSAVENIVAIARRRLLAAERGEAPLGGRPTVSGYVLSALFHGQIDDRRLGDLLFGLALLDSGVPSRAASPEGADDVLPWFGILRAVCSPRVLAVDGCHPSPAVITRILARLEARDLDGALRLAAGRLQGSGRELRASVRAIAGTLSFAAVAAALVIPLPNALEDRLVGRVLRPQVSSFNVKEVPRA